MSEGRLNQSRRPAARSLTFTTAAATLLVALLGTAGPVLTGDIPLAKRRSTYEQMSAETRAMQDEDTANPAMLWVLDGEALWRAKAGVAGPCADCQIPDLGAIATDQLTSRRKIRAPALTRVVS